EGKSAILETQIPQSRQFPMIDRSCSLEYRTFQRCSLVGEGESSSQLSLVFCVSPYSWTLHGSATGNHPWSGGKPFQLLATVAGWPAGGATPTPTSRDVTNQAEYVAEKRCHDDDR
ncbi:hypothetical protein ALC56_08843, partial [Trachymyrmex septentrionalis]